MKVFAHLNDYIWLTNYKLQNMSNTWHTRGLDSLSYLLIKSHSAVFYFSRKLGHKITIS